MRVVRSVTAALVAAVAVGCGDSTPTFREPRVLWGRTVSADVLNRGEAAYQRYCMVCHGREGDGRGPQGLHQTPAPRDFRTGRFKLTRSPDGRPTDAELEHTIRHGSPGTQMVAWPQLEQAEVDALVQYVKTFSSPPR